MSESSDTTQPTLAAKPADKPPSDTQEIKPISGKKKPSRILIFFINILVFLLIIGLGVFGGYQSGISIRKNAQARLETQQLSDQFSLAIVDIQFGNYSSAQQRLEYIIGIDPSFPGALEKMTEVMVLSTIPTEIPLVSATPELILDDTNYEGLIAQARDLIITQQWQNVLTVLDTLRRKDATFKAVEIDGMYYFALRNLGVAFIQAGNLEGGIYELTLAERFAPLDNTAHVLRDNSRFYITAASFWKVDWKLTAEYFSQLNGSGIWDGTMNATVRYNIAAQRYGDELFGRGEYCQAYEQYEAAQTAGQLDEGSAKNANQAYQACFPATAVPTQTGLATDLPPTDPPATTPPPAETLPTDTPPSN